ncbi:MAG: cell wall hydrolase [Lachnospiraceae bacterium]|nr:cell wall hydrolase [Lachnospiraceae bacterium]
MLKRVVGAVAVMSIAVSALGMGYPQENENQPEVTAVVDAVAVSEQLVQAMEAVPQDVQTICEQGTESVAALATQQAQIQDSSVPLAVEVSKRSTTLTEEELELMLKVVSAEARGESWDAQYMVACVILNRMESDLFPNTLTEVVTQTGQFSCVPYAIRNVPITDSVREAVAAALDDNILEENVLWFRSDYYHPFETKAFQIGRMYFTSL